MEASASRAGHGGLRFPRRAGRLFFPGWRSSYPADSIGLSAPQVGLNVQLLVFNAAGERGIGEELVFINPKVQKLSQKQVLFNEGCLSFPGIYADVEASVFKG